MILKPDEVVQRNADSSATLETTKVLHLINGEHFSGAERVQDLLAMRLPEFGFEVGFVCLKANKFPRVRESKTELFELEMKSRFDIFRSSEVVRIAKDHGYQVLHAHTPRSLMIASRAARQMDCPLVYHVHSPVGRDSNKSLRNRINTWMESWCLRRVDQMICVSASLADYMQQLGHNTNRISVVCNGVAPLPEIQPRAAFRKPFMLGAMALFRPRKGTEILLDAIAILQSRGIIVHLRAVGPFETTEYEGEILQRVEMLGIQDQIHWTGFQRDVQSQLAQMDLFVLPSLYGEGLPMVVLEAMASAVPVVASRVEGIPEAVRDGIDGLIFEPGEPSDLADKIEWMIADEQRWVAMSVESLQRQRQFLSDVSMARGVSDVYRTLR